MDSLPAETQNRLGEFRAKLSSIVGKGIDSLHFIRGWQSYLLNNFTHNSLEKNTWEELNHYPVALFSEKTIHIEIKETLILVNFIMHHPESMVSKNNRLWAYDTKLCYDGQAWPLHELPSDLKTVLKDAEGIEFSYGGKLLPLPQALKAGILDVLQSNDLDSPYFDCHAFARGAGKQLNYKNYYDQSIEVSFDRALFDAFGVRGHHQSENQNWTNLIPRIVTASENEAHRLNLKYAKAGANFFFRAGPYPFAGGHSAIEIGPDLLLSKMGRMGLTIAPVQSLAFDEGSKYLRITEVIGTENNHRFLPESQFVDEMRLEHFINHLREHFVEIKVLDEFERSLAWLSFSSPLYVEAKEEYNKSYNPHYENSLFEQFQFWLLERIRESNSADDIINEHLEKIKSAVYLTASEEKYWFNEFFFHEQKHLLY